MQQLYVACWCSAYVNMGKLHSDSHVAPCEVDCTECSAILTKIPNRREQKLRLNGTMNFVGNNGTTVIALAEVDEQHY